MGMKTPVELMLDGLEWTAIPRESESSGDLPFVTHEGVLEVMGTRLRCYQLSSGERVFDADDIAEFCGLTLESANENDAAGDATPEANGKE